MIPEIETPFEPLVKRIVTVQSSTRKATIDIWTERFWIGVEIHNMEKQRGKSIVKNLATQAGVSEWLLYKWLEIAREFNCDFNTFNHKLNRMLMGENNLSYAPLLGIRSKRSEPALKAQAEDDLDAAQGMVEYVDNELQRLAPFIVKSVRIAERIRTESPALSAEAKSVETAATEIKEKLDAYKRALIAGKPRQRVEDPTYLELVRLQPCYICTAKPPSDPHHIETGGIGTKGSDYSAVPLCRKCHGTVEDGNWNGEFEWEYLYNLLRTYLELK